MRGLFSQPHGEDVEFELFSNIVLKFTAILIVVMVLLALNVGQKLDSIISPNSFSGGLARPALYIGMWDLDDPRVKEEFGRGGYYVSLASPSLEAATTIVKDGKLISSVEGETFSGQISGSIIDILQILSGIDPGSFTVDGQSSPLIVPNFSKKQLAANNDESVNLPPDPDLALKLLQIWNPAYKKKVFPVRAYEEFSKARAKIYIETPANTKVKQIMIGDYIFDLNDLKSGKLDFLTGLSSANAEVVYLGTYAAEFDKKTNSRIAFFETQGFPEVAAAFRKKLYPGESELAEAVAAGVEIGKSFDAISETERAEWVKSALGDEARARTYYAHDWRVWAWNEYRRRYLVKIIRQGREPSKSDLPPILAYPEAWRAYIEHRLSQKPIPPPWLAQEFLAPLGFDKRVVLLDSK